MSTENNKTTLRRHGWGRIARGVLRPAIVAIVALGFVACAEEDTAPVADVDYHGWRQSTSAVLSFPVPGHGDGLRKIFVNDLGFDAELVEDGSVTYPEGTIFVKEVYATPDPAEDAQPVMLTIMVKDSEDPRNRGGWVWLVRDPESGSETLFDEEFCVTCHANANESHPYGTQNMDEAFRDYVFHAPALEAASE